MQDRTRVAIATILVFLASASGCDRNSPTEPETIDCVVFPDQETSPYVLPYPVGSAFVATPHIDRSSGPQRFAIDMEMPLGSPVVAMRSGVVRKLETSYFDGDNKAGHENFIFVVHDDGSTARYIHLTHNGAAVRVGESVMQGQVIGSSGNTGNSSAPHLHFDVTDCCCVNSPNYNALPCGQTHPLTFRNTIPHPCGLQRGVLYEAF